MNNKIWKELLQRKCEKFLIQEIIHINIIYKYATIITIIGASSVNFYYTYNSSV